MAAELKTGRGVYRLTLAAPLESSSGEIILTLALERADGVERVVFRCRVAQALAAPSLAAEPDRLLERIARWAEREFEQTREAALKSIRTQQKLLEIVFDREQPGPF